MMTPNDDELAGGTIDLSGSRIPISSRRRTSDNIVIRPEPRISANKLAEYMVAGHTRQRTIIKDAKYVKTALAVPYTKARTVIARAFNADGLNAELLRQGAVEIESAQTESEWQRGDNKRSAAALKNIAEMASEFSWKEAKIIHKPSSGWGHLKMEGVQVSVSPEIVFTFKHRNITKVGAILINTAIDNGKALSRNSGAPPCVGDYLSSLLFQMLVNKLGATGAPLHSKCVTVDVFRKEIFCAPTSYRSLNNQLEAACQVIALRWPTIEQQV